MKKKKNVKSKPKVYEFSISLAETSPKVWRKVLAHEFIELNELHLLIQMAMGWEDYHLYSFFINDKHYTDEESALELNHCESDGVLLCDILADTKNFTYTYDFGDDWKHEIEITNILEDDPRMKYPVCIDGENACPPEDCGGPYRFEELKKIIAGKESEEKNEVLTWLGGFYNPKTFDPNFVNKHFFWDDFDA